MFKYKAAACALATVALTAAPIQSASAQYYYCGIVCGVGSLVAGVVGTAAAIATAPFVALAPRPYPYYAARPAYYGPPPPYYAPPRAYYGPPRAYYPPPGYYAPPGYYGPR
jgi:hypothetical protein